VAPPVEFHDAEGVGGYAAGEYAVRILILPLVIFGRLFLRRLSLFSSSFLTAFVLLSFVSFRFRSRIRRCGTRRDEILARLEGDAHASVPATERAKLHQTERSAYTAACDEDKRSRGHRICEEAAVYG
jgi:hypothetical protein